MEYLEVWVSYEPGDESWKLHEEAAGGGWRAGKVKLL